MLYQCFVIDADVVSLLYQCCINVILILYQCYIFVAIDTAINLIIKCRVSPSNIFRVCRYFAVCHPALYVDVFRPWNTAGYVTLCWSLTLTVSAMPLFGWSTYHFESSERFCFADWAASVSYAVFMVTLCFCIPALVLATTNFLIFRQMHQSKNKIRQFENNSTGGANGVENATKARQRRDEFRLAKSMLTIILCFFLSWFTFAFCAFVSSFRLVEVPGWLSMMSLLLGYSNSCLNPFIYGLMNTNVRNA